MPRANIAIFFIADLFSAHERSPALSRSCYNIGCIVSKSTRSELLSDKKNRAEDRTEISARENRRETGINSLRVLFAFRIKSHD